MGVAGLRDAYAARDGRGGHCLAPRGAVLYSRRRRAGGPETGEFPRLDLMNSVHDHGGRFLSEEHDHRHCLATALQDAKTVCVERGARLTPVRRRVLEIIWQSHRPLGAYAILEVLSGEGHSPAPPTVYRALEFLLTHGLVHRLSSLNAFIGCTRPGHPGAGQFLLCTACGTAAELNDPGIERAIECSAEAEGFTSQVHTVEISGLCPHCRGA